MLGLAIKCIEVFAYEVVRQPFKKNLQWLFSFKAHNFLEKFPQIIFAVVQTYLRQKSNLPKVLHLHQI